MEEEYDPLSHLSTALSLLPRTLADIGFSLPIALSEVDQMDAFFDHMYKVLKMKQQRSTISHDEKPSRNPQTIDTDKTGKSFEGQVRDVKLESSESTQLERRPLNNSCADELSPHSDSLQTERCDTRNSNQGQGWDVEDMEVEPLPGISSHADKPSSNTNSSMVDKDKTGKDSYEGKNGDPNFESVKAAMMEPQPSISSDSHNPSQAPDKTTIEREISGKVSSHPEQIVEDRRSRGRPGLGLVYNISPFKLIQKNEKAKQVVPVDFTVLDHISDPEAFIKKAYELEAAVAEIQRLGGEAKMIGERVFKVVEDDHPRRFRTGLGLQMKRPKFVPLPMHPLPIKVQPACTCQNSAPAQSTRPPETTKVTDFSGSQNEASSSISNVINEVPEMYASSSFEKLFSNLESIPDDEAKAVAMVFDLLNLKQHVIPLLVIPEIPKFSRLDVVRSPWTQLPSIERLRELRGEDPLVSFQELKRKFFGRNPAAYSSDDDTNPLPGVGSVRSPSTSPGYQFSFENEEIDTPSHAGPSGSPNVEMEEFPSQEKVPEMTFEARGGNFSDNDDAGNDMPDGPEMHSPRDNSPVNIEVAASGMPMENPPVNIKVSPSAVPLEYQPEEEVVIKEASSRKGKKRGLEHAVVEGALEEVGGLRRSTRIRSRPLRHWMGERLLYARVDDKFPAAVGVKECSPATVGIRVKVRSFMSDKHADLVAQLAKY
ncbi:uncharacterized protein LOC144561683 isoform X2 [Carex rostrata]